MRIEWDRGKNRRNVAKHGIAFQQAALVFEDPHALSSKEREVDGEERWQTLGSLRGVLIVVAHTYYEEYGEEVIRIISARKATPSQRRAYEESQWPVG